jgi:hypothetical protein
VSCRSDPIERARLVLDRFEVRRRLEEVRDFVWRGGEVRFRDDHGRVGYELEARWERALLVPLEAPNGLVPTREATVEGRWVRAATGYALAVDIDLAAPTGIAVREPGRRQVVVPLVGRTDAHVRAGLDRAFEAYARSFLDTHAPVPQAMAADAELLRRHAP